MKLRYTRPALDDLDQILTWVAERSPLGASNVHRRLRAVIDLLCEFPHIGAPTSDPVIRRMTAHPYPYLVFYEVGDDEIIIHAVRHGARDPQSMPGSN